MPAFRAEKIRPIILFVANFNRGIVGVVNFKKAVILFVLALSLFLDDLLNKIYEKVSLLFFDSELHSGCADDMHEQIGKIRIYGTI